MKRHKSKLLRRTRGETGQVLVLFAVALVVLFGMAGLVIDIGYAFYAKRSMQASADAAALAGASQLPSAAAATSAAMAYGGAAGAKNENGNVPGVNTNVATKCAPVAPCNPINAITVTQTSNVPPSSPGSSGSTASTSR